MNSPLSRRKKAQLWKSRNFTADYEVWISARMPLLADDLAAKHQAMADDPFKFFRATYYAWVQRWAEVSADLAAAPEVLSVGDLHVENFGTWRDAEGRLIWGINDFDEAYPMAYTNDLVRLAASACLAIEQDSLSLSADDACHAIREGYQGAMEKGGQPWVLSEQHHWLRSLAIHRLENPSKFWDKMNGFAVVHDTPAAVVEMLESHLPERGVHDRIVHRIAGLGSLGRRRYVALMDWRGGLVAREAKKLTISACLFQRAAPAGTEILYPAILAQAMRAPDPFVDLRGNWLIRRLAPDCSRIELETLPHEGDEGKLLEAMGWETANIHLGDPARTTAIRDDLHAGVQSGLPRRPARWSRRPSRTGNSGKRKVARSQRTPPPRLIRSNVAGRERPRALSRTAQPQLLRR